MKRSYKIILVAAILLVLEGGLYLTRTRARVNTSALNCMTISAETTDEEQFGKYVKNMVQFDVDGISFEAYASGDGGNDGLLYLNLNYEDDYFEPLTGYFANVDPIYGIRALDIVYKSDAPLYVSYGNNACVLEETYELNPADDYTLVTVDLKKEYDFFSIDCEESGAYIQSIDIYYSGDNVTDETETEVLESDRKTPTGINYEPEEGDTIVTLDGTEYTYHTFDYVKDLYDAGIDISEYALTDPTDVANYFTYFNRIPVNYGTEIWNLEDGVTVIQGYVPDVDTVAEIFDDELVRAVTEYHISTYSTELSNYCRNLPQRAYSRYEEEGFDEGDSLSYEFDIALDDQYNVHGGRDLGRVVGLCEGFAVYDDYVNVCLFTDDHYLTFMEYLNDGTWSERFNAKSEIGTAYSYPTE